MAIFKDRVEIINPGRLYGGLKVKDIMSKSISKRRNSLIADIFHRVNLVEKWGTGISKIKKLEPKATFEELDDFFMVTFKRKNVPKNAQERQGLILSKVQNNIPFTKRDLAEEFGVDSKTIQRDFNELKDQIKFAGSKKGGKWVLKKT